MSRINFSLNHLGIDVIDIDKMTEFYTSFFGFVVTDERGGDNPIRFLTMSPDEHHQLLLVSGRKPESPSTIAQISFLIDGISEVRKVYERVTADDRLDIIGAGIGPHGFGVKVAAVDHGNSWTVYFKDPEGNIIECYAHTPWHVSQPYGVKIDFSKTDAEIYALTENTARANPTFAPAETFRANLAERLAR